MTRSRPSSSLDHALPAKKRQSKPKQSEKYYDTEGDIELLSSDNVIFKLHAYRSQASSDMIKVGINGRIELTDLDLETDEVISSLFAIMIEDANILDMPRSTNRRSIVAFAQKYDFTNEVGTIKQHLQIALSPHDLKVRSPWAVFKLAMYPDDHQICSAALKTTGRGLHWQDGAEYGKEDRFGKHVKQANVFDPTGWSLADPKDTPIEIVWALLRVSHVSKPLSEFRLQAAMNFIAEGYFRLMALKDAPRGV